MKVTQRTKASFNAHFKRPAIKQDPYSLVEKLTDTTLAAP